MYRKLILFALLGSVAYGQTLPVAQLPPAVFIQNANFAFVGHSLVAGLHSTSGPITAPYSIPTSGYRASTTGTALN